MMKTVPGVPKRAGSKGEAVVSALAAKGEAGATRAELAETVGCTVARVGEVVRALRGAVKKVGKVYSLAVPESDVSLILDDGPPAPATNEVVDVPRTVAQLRDAAKAAGIKGRHAMNRAQLLTAIADHGAE